MLKGLRNRQGVEEWSRCQGVENHQGLTRCSGFDVDACIGIGALALHLALGKYLVCGSANSSGHLSFLLMWLGYEH